MKSNSILHELNESAEILQIFIQSDQALQAIENAIKLMSNALLKGNKIISCGNGGSMSDAMHFAEELTGKFRNERKSLAAIAISDPAYITCTANDYGFEKIFSRFIEGIGKEGDILLAISTSGNSANVIEAVKIAKEKKMPVIALTGMEGGKLAALVDVEIRAPHSKFSDRAQEIHIKVIHTLIKHIEQTVLQQS
ncbi:MAG TPA: D-sedoheptulose 7-phosphate isomerase [Bacteroidia bacterium]|nr:D-sedoheptulose 7-phosphate isomerase [Bacteroidia bacterium]